MRGTLKSTTNERFNHLVGKNSDIEIDKCAYFLGLRTSKLIRVEFDEKMITIKTKNSIYIFEIY